MPAQKAFTLIELLVVISIITILSSIGFVSYQEVRGKAIETRRKADIDSIKKAYETKYDPTANNGQGGYKPLEDKDFSSGKIPDGITFVAGPNVTGGAQDGFAVCASLTDNNQCFQQSTTCSCSRSTQGSDTVTFAPSASDGQRITIMQNVAAALERYKTANGRYPRTGGDVGTEHPNCSNFPEWNQGGFAGLLSVLINQGYISKPVLDNDKDISCGGGAASWGDLGRGAMLGDSVCGWDHCGIYEFTPWPGGYHYWSNGTNYKLILIQSDNSRYQLSR